MTIEFDLTLPNNMTELPLKLLVARGNKKTCVIRCFEELQALGFGVFDRGGKGRGNSAKFIPNENCPIKHSINIEKKKLGRPKKN